MKRLIIFEGPDGAGKSTLAQAIAAEMGAAFAHHGPYPEIQDGDALADIYYRSMLPAVYDRCHVALDRCWISEVPYGLAFRDGKDRLGDARRACLEESARYADARVYLCLPPWDRVSANYEARKGAEYLRSIDELWQVYDWYRTKKIANLSVTVIDPFDGRDHLREIIDG